MRIWQTGLVWLWVSVFVIVLDRLSKWWVQVTLTPFEPLQVLPFFNLTFVYNRGAAFSFLHNASGWQNLFLGSLAILVSLFILVWLYRQKANALWSNIALSLILGGALGNAFDRVLYGYVIDYFDFHLGDWHFAIFNVADSAISVGAFMMIVYWLLPFKNKAAVF